MSPLSPTTLYLDPNPNSNWNWNWGVQFVITALIIGIGFLHLLRTTASKYLLLNPNSNSNSNSNSTSTTSSFCVSSSTTMGGADNKCAVCNSFAKKHCAACKLVFYCSLDCQSNHWKSNHRKECQSIGKVKPQQATITKRGMGIALVPSSGPDKVQKVVDKVLFPYDEFLELYDWDKAIFPPCGLLNCGNSCFANVVLQCLVHTRPLLEYLLGKGHRRDCKRYGWCFLCELECFMTNVSKNPQPFAPMNILSRLRSIGGNLGYGDQEDAHEFMRFSIGAMQSVCLDEHGGEKFIDPKSQETTLIQHIFGGQLRSQVICTKCNQVSNQYENMMDLTVEIQGDATSLEECLDQFTSKEWLHGENLYRCDACKDYVSAWKRLTIHQAPNVLTIALKRFQSGRFGKINKKISFPEILDLGPYMNEERDGMDIYKLYAVIVHVDMLNASFFGHYICYTKGFEGDWYRIDDCKVVRVGLDEVLSQGAYMLLYRRIIPRPQCLKTYKPTSQQKNLEKVSTMAKHSTAIPTVDTSSNSEPSSSNCSSVNGASDGGRQLDHAVQSSNSETSSSNCSSVNVASDGDRQLDHAIDTDLEDSQAVVPVSNLPSVVENGNVNDNNNPHSIAESSNQVPDMPSSSSVDINIEELKIFQNGPSSAIGEASEQKFDHDKVALGKVESEGFPNDVEMKSVEVNGYETDCASNGVTNMVIDG